MHKVSPKRAYSSLAASSTATALLQHPRPTGGRDGSPTYRAHPVKTLAVQESEIEQRKELEIQEANWTFFNWSKQYLAHEQVIYFLLTQVIL